MDIENTHVLRRSQRLKNKLNPSHGSKLSGNKYHLFTHNFNESKKRQKHTNRNSFCPCVSRCNRQLRMVHHNPNVFSIDNFLTDNEINHLLNIVQNNSSKFETSYTQATGKDQIYSTERTSTFIFLEKYMDKISRAIEARAADILSISIENVEPLQMIKYTEGQEFTLHHDAGTLINERWSLTNNHSNHSNSSNGSNNGQLYKQQMQQLQKQSVIAQKQIAALQEWKEDNSSPLSEEEEEDEFSVSMVAPIRLFSFFVYLTTLPENCGGETYFPKLGLKVRPQRGKAVLWSNVDPNNALRADPMLIHRAMPVKGDYLKVGMNIWVDIKKYS